MLPPPMRRVAVSLVCLLIAVGIAATMSACGAEAESEAAEGEPVEVADLAYNVALTRFLNPDDDEDAEYLVGMPPPPPRTSYLGVFLTIANETDTARPSAHQYTVSDTLHNDYDALPSKSPYALEIGAEVPADGQLPLPDTTAQTGPNQGSLLIFLVDDSVSDNRPLTLLIESDAGNGEVILDI
jgi:hypothetical protein